MQIILLEKVVNLGQLGDVVRVRDGFARNFLIPKGKARRATEEAKKEFEARRAELERIQAEKLAAARIEGDKLSGKTVTISEKAGVDGRLFGSVTNANIADALRKEGFATVDKSMVRVGESLIKTIGEHPVQIALHSDVVVDIVVQVQPDH